MLEVNDRIRIPLSELKFTFSRSSGPGGQNVNKVNSKVTLQWPVSDSASLPAGVRERFLERYASRIDKRGALSVTSQRFRDRGRNVADCLSKLRQMILEVATAPKRRKPTGVPRAARRRRLVEKRKQAEKKERRRPPSD